MRHASSLHANDAELKAEGTGSQLEAAHEDGRQPGQSEKPEPQHVDGKVFYRRCGKDSFQVHGNDFFLTRDKE